jgi:serine protease Do
MEELQLLDAIERYLNGQMSAEEKQRFEQLRKENPDVDQRVVEHTFFLHQMEQFGDIKNLKSTLNDIHSQLRAEGAIKEEKRKATIVELWKKYKRVVAVAASIAGITAISISVIAYLFTPKANHSEYRQLAQRFARLENKQKGTEIEISQLKNQISTTKPKADPKLGGTGFLIDGKGYLVTSAHVVVNADSVYVQNVKGDYYKASTIYINKQSDIAILKIEDNRFQFVKSLPYSISKNNSDLGEEIFTLGYPRSNAEIVYNRGYLSAGTGYNGDTLAYQIAISANPGNSGGPIFNEAGDVIGVLSGKQESAEGVFFSSRSKNIYTALQEIRKDSTSEDRIKLPVTVPLRTLNRTQQIKRIEECVFMVKSY